MLTSVTLQNFKSFGEAQTIPLHPVTVLCGPNSSGKSSFMSVGRLVRRSVRDGADAAVLREGGATSLFHRPASDSAEMRVGWRSDEGSYITVMSRSGSKLAQRDERLEHDRHGSAWTWGEAAGKKAAQPSPAAPNTIATAPFAGLCAVASSASRELRRFRGVWAPIVHSREVRLSVEALRQDADVVPEPLLGTGGSGLAAVLGLWRGAYPDKTEQLHAFLRHCLPEVRHVLVKPAPEPARQRLWVQQTDGEKLDAAHLSTGALCLIALAMHAIAAEPGTLLFIEEPERSIHPRNLRALVDLLCRTASEQRCQVVFTTYSPVVVTAFRERPEALMLFRRAEHGTRVTPLTEHPELAHALAGAEPGEMLANGLF